MLKKPSQLDDADVRLILCNLLERTQDLEVHMAEIACLALFAVDQIEPPSDAEFADTVARVITFLKRTSEHLREINDTSERIMDQQERQN